MVLVQQWCATAVLCLIELTGRRVYVLASTSKKALRCGHLLRFGWVWTPSHVATGKGIEKQTTRHGTARHALPERQKSNRGLRFRMEYTTIEKAKLHWIKGGRGNRGRGPLSVRNGIGAAGIGADASAGRGCVTLTLRLTCLFSCRGYAVWWRWIYCVESE